MSAREMTAAEVRETYPGSAAKLQDYADRRAAAQRDGSPAAENAIRQVDVKERALLEQKGIAFNPFEEQEDNPHCTQKRQARNVKDLEARFPQTAERLRGLAIQIRQAAKEGAPIQGRLEIEEAEVLKARGLRSNPYSEEASASS